MDLYWHVLPDGQVVLAPMPVIAQRLKERYPHATYTFQPPALVSALIEAPDDPPSDTEPAPADPYVSTGAVFEDFTGIAKRLKEITDDQAMIDAYKKAGIPVPGTAEPAPVCAECLNLGFWRDAEFHVHRCTTCPSSDDWAAL